MVCIVEMLVFIFCFAIGSGLVLMVVLHPVLLNRGCFLSLGMCLLG